MITADLDSDSLKRAYMAGWRRGVIGLLDREPSHRMKDGSAPWNDEELRAFVAGHEAGCTARRRANNEARLAPVTEAPWA